MKKNACFLLAAGFLVALAAGFLTAKEKSANKPKPAGEAKEAKHKADEDAIRKLSAEFTSALEKGNAKAVAGFWTEEGEYIADDGTTIRGRADIEEAYTKLFGKSPKLKLQVTIDSIHFNSHDSAIEQGIAQAKKGESEQQTSSRYSTLYVRENGQWLIALLREWPDDGVALQDLAWLIGTWEAKAPVAEVRTTYEWNEGKNFIKVAFAIKQGDHTVTGTQMIGKDPRNNQLRSWLFEGEGGFGESVWSLDGKRWLQDATGVQADGSQISATNIMTPLDKDSFTWQSVNRSVDGEELPDIAPVKVTRVK